MRILLLLVGGVFLLGCTPTVKKVVFNRSGDDVVVVKRSSFTLSSEEKSFISREAKKFGIKVPERKEIERFLKLYLRNKRSLEVALKRANLYAPYIKPILEEYGLPEELTLLPLIESGFNPFAVSPSGAAGIWQIMPQTARRFGLRVDRYVDERFDLIKSTHAAARYLKELYRMFGNWELVLAAYNCGEGCVRRRTGSRNFWQTRWALPEQTRKYVPMFFATLLIARSPDRYGLKVDMDNLFLDKKVLERTYAVKDFLKTTGIKESTFRDLNPHIKGNFIPAGVYVYLPRSSFYQAENRGPENAEVFRKPEHRTKVAKSEGTDVKRKPEKRKHDTRITKNIKKERPLKPTRGENVVYVATEFAPKLVVRTKKGDQIKILHRRIRTVQFENGALLYIKE